MGCLSNFSTYSSSTETSLKVTSPELHILPLLFPPVTQDMEPPYHCPSVSKTWHHGLFGESTNYYITIHIYIYIHVYICYSTYIICIYIYIHISYVYIYIYIYISISIWISSWLPICFYFQWPYGVIPQSPWCSSWTVSSSWPPSWKCPGPGRPGRPGGPTGSSWLKQRTIYMNTWWIYGRHTKCA